MCIRDRDQEAESLLAHWLRQPGRSSWPDCTSNFADTIAIRLQCLFYKASVIVLHHRLAESHELVNFSIPHEIFSLFCQMFSHLSLLWEVYTNENHIVINLYYRRDDPKLCRKDLAFCLHSNSSGGPGVIVKRQDSVARNLAPFGHIGLSNLCQEFRVVYRTNCSLFK